MERLTERGHRGNALLKGTVCRYASISFDCDIEGGREKLEQAFEKLAQYEDMEEKGLIAQCTCKECNKGDWSGCAEDTIYCMEHGSYFSWSDSFNKAEKDDE